MSWSKPESIPSLHEISSTYHIAAVNNIVPVASPWMDNLPEGKPLKTCQECTRQKLTCDGPPSCRTCHRKDKICIFLPAGSKPRAKKGEGSRFKRNLELNANAMDWAANHGGASGSGSGIMKEDDESNVIQEDQDGGGDEKKRKRPDENETSEKGEEPKKRRGRQAGTKNKPKKMPLGGSTIANEPADEMEVDQ